MTIKSILGSVVTALVLFVFGFLYWAVNPLPYATWNEVENPAAAQASAAQLFPEDGTYFLPGPGNDPEALKLLENGPAVFLTIDHTPAAGADPIALATGFLHNLLSALALAYLLTHISGLANRLKLSVAIGVLGVVVINGSEIVWWLQPVSWIAHQAVYYLIYFGLAAWVLNFFLPRDSATS